MYFWNVDRLKTELSHRTFTEREMLPYMIATFAAFSVAVAIPIERAQPWNWIEPAFDFAMTLAGTLYLYHCNGGDRGRDFLKRWFTIGWVMTIRFLVVSVLAAIPFSLAYALALRHRPGDGAKFLFFASLQLVFLWLLARHFRDLGRRDTTVSTGEPFHGEALPV
jgi:hypothetical protein